MTDFHALPQQPSAEDRFADALDAIALGMPLRGTGADPLAGLAATLQGIGACPESADDVSTAPNLDRASKSRIWADLMAEHGGADTSQSAPQTPGAMGSVLSLNPWVGEKESLQPKRVRPSSGVLRFMPTAQPASTFLLIVAVLVLVGATFAGLSPNGGRGGIPTARATEGPAHLAFASPEASPAVECNAQPLTNTQIQAIRDTGSTQPPRQYSPAVVASQATFDYAREITDCTYEMGEAIDFALLWAMMTDRAVLENPLGVSNDAQRERSREISEQYGESLLGPAPTAEELERLSQASTSPYSSEIVYLFDPARAVVRELPDGRVAVYSGDVWLRRGGTTPDGSQDREIFYMMILGNPKYGGGIDESLYICLGDCDSFWNEWETDTYLMPGETPATTPAASPVASPEASPATATSGSATFCIGQPVGSSDAELREMSIDDWLFPSSYPAEEVEPAVAQAIHDTYISYRQCLAQPAILENPNASDPEAVASYLSDRNRFTLLYDELNQDQQAGIDEYACLPLTDRLLESFPLPINATARFVAIPTTNPPPPGWENPLRDTPIYNLGDGRYGMMLGAVSFAALEDPSKATENDWLMFVAFVEVDGYFYIDEEITLLAAPTSEHGTPPPADDECA